MSEISVYSWFRRWEKGGIAGLRDKKGHGRKPVLMAEDLPQSKNKCRKMFSG